MALYTHHANRKREPLGGRESEGFGAWIEEAALMSAEGRKVLSSRPLGDAIRYISVSAERDYAVVLASWRNLTRDATRRDDFEVGLIAAVMGSRGAARFARDMGYGPGDTCNGGRPMADVAAAYLRSCMTLAAYVGVTPEVVMTCGEDQDKLSALRA